MLGYLKPLERLFSKKSKGDLKGALMGIATVFIVLYILVIVLGNLMPVMDSAIPADSPLAQSKNALTENTKTFFTIGALVGVIAIAMLIINILS